MALYVSRAKRRRRAAILAASTLVVGLLIGFGVGSTRTKSVEHRVRAVHSDADHIATRLVALDIEYRDAFSGGADDFDTSVTQPLDAIQTDTVRLLDRAPWVRSAQRDAVLDELAKLVVLARTRVAPDQFLAALQNAAVAVRATFGADKEG